ncbi:MAG: hypothetical protein V6Z89_22690 [Desulfobacter sp.]
MLDIAKTTNQLKMMILVGMMILAGQKIGFDYPVVDALPGIVFIIIIAMLSLVIKDLTPKLKFPAFAWATMIGLVLSMPFMPTAGVFLEQTNKVHFLATTTPILAFAGISVGNKIDELKQISWKIVIVAMTVFCGTFFGSAIIAQLVLKFQGII